MFRRKCEEATFWDVERAVQDMLRKTMEMSFQGAFVYRYLKSRIDKFVVSSLTHFPDDHHSPSLLSSTTHSLNIIWSNLR